MSRTVVPSMFKEIKHGESTIFLSKVPSKFKLPHKIHILGEDERSKFIAHALCGVYDSVELLATRMKEVDKDSPSLQHTVSRRYDTKLIVPEKPLVTPRLLEEEDDSHIDQLLVSGNGHHALAALNAVKHRVDETTSICLMNDGLGVLEDAQSLIFNDRITRPNIMLGHMTHRLRFNKSRNAVRELRGGLFQITSPYTEIVSQHENGQDMIQSLESARLLNASFTPLDQWFRLKLPSIIFESVADPLCVFLDVPYRALRFKDGKARELMSQMLTEILTIIEAMPELAGSTIIRDFISGTGPRRILEDAIMAKGSQPCELALQISQVHGINVDFLNGYFVRRAKQLNVPAPYNTIIHNMLKVKHSQAVYKSKHYIPVEERYVATEEDAPPMPYSRYQPLHRRS